MELIGHSQKKQYGNSRRKTESVFKAIMADNFPNLGREMDIQICESQRTSKRLNLNKATLQHIIKLAEIKENFENGKRKKLHTRESP